MERKMVVQKTIKQLKFDDKEFQEILKLPEIRKIDLEDGERMPNSSQCAAICNSLGLFFYAIDNKVAVMNCNGLRAHLECIKEEKVGNALEVPLKGFQSKGTAAILDFGENEESPVMRVCVSEDQGLAVLLVAFPRVAYSVKIDELSKGSVVPAAKYTANSGGVIEKCKLQGTDIVVLESNSGKKTIEASIKLQKKPSTTSIIDCRLVLTNS